jgi:hypothetical protein
MLSPGKDALGHATYERHRPEQTLLYQLVEKHYPALGYWQLNFLRPKQLSLRSQATALLHSVNTLTLRSR